MISKRIPYKHFLTMESKSLLVLTRNFQFFYFIIIEMDFMEARALMMTFLLLQSAWNLI